MEDLETVRLLGRLIANNFKQINAPQDISHWSKGAISELLGHITKVWEGIELEQLPDTQVLYNSFHGKEYGKINDERLAIIYYAFEEKWEPDFFRKEYGKVAPPKQRTYSPTYWLKFKGSVNNKVENTNEDILNINVDEILEFHKGLRLEYEYSTDLSEQLLLLEKDRQIEEASKYLDSIIISDDRILSSKFFLKAGYAHLQGKPDEAIKLYLRSLELDNNNKYLLNSTGVLMIRLGNYLAAKNIFLHALSLHSDDVVSSASIHSNLGYIYIELGDSENAIKYLEAALKVQEGISKAITLNNIASLYYKRAEFSSALRSFKEALKIESKIEDTPFENIVTRKNNIGIIQMELGEYEEAKNTFIELRECVAAKNKQDSLLPFIDLNIGDAWFRLDNNKTALYYLHRALKDFRISLPNTHTQIARCIRSVVKVEIDKKQFLKAFELINEAKNIDEHSLPHNTFSTAMNYKLLGAVLGGLERWDEAEVAARHAIDILSQCFSNNIKEIESVERLLMMIQYKSISTKQLK